MGNKPAYRHSVSQYQTEVQSGESIQRGRQTKLEMWIIRAAKHQEAHYFYLVVDLHVWRLIINFSYGSI